MHEHGLIQNILQKIEMIADEQGARSIRSIQIQLGALSHCTPTHFKEHFDEVARGTIAEGVELKFEELKDTQDPLAQEIILKSVELEE